MTDIDSLKAQLEFLRAVRGCSGYVAITEVPGWDLVGAIMYRDLVDRGLLYLRDGRITTSSEVDRLLDQIDAQGVALLAQFEPCPYDFAHTRNWCNRPTCRES